MPTLANLREVWSTDSNQTSLNFNNQSDEMVIDTRAYLSPSQQVEQKLHGALRKAQFASQPVSRMQHMPKPR